MLIYLRLNYYLNIKLRNIKFFINLLLIKPLIKKSTEDIINA